MKFFLHPDCPRSPDGHFQNVRQVIADSLGAEDAVRDVEAEHDAVFVLLHGRDI